MPYTKANPIEVAARAPKVLNFVIALTIGVNIRPAITNKNQSFSLSLSMVITLLN